MSDTKEKSACCFDTVIDRRGSGSLKWEVGKDELALWVADMDFQTAPAVREALENRVKHGIFGYATVGDEWRDAYCSWWERRHGFSMNRDSLIFCTGVVPAISSAVRKLTSVAEKVVIMTPVYNIFFNSIINNGRYVVESPLRYEEGEYSVDFESLEHDLSDEQATLLILCNPHNPAGKIWSKDELERIGQLCEKHHVTVLSDEIHCDITRKGTSYTPFASVNETNKRISVTLLSASKAFNLAGLQSAAVYAEDKVLHHKMWRALNTDEVAEPNVFAVPATVAAFNKGEEWLEELRGYIDENRKEAETFIEKRLPRRRAVKADATYLLWVDCSAVTDNADELCAVLREQTGLYISEGSQYGKAGAAFVRINLACPRIVLKEALLRLEKGTDFLIKAKKTIDTQSPKR